jgi:phage terminase large subunit-like protein
MATFGEMVRAARERRGEMVEDEEGALWSAETVDDTRAPSAPKLARALLCLDPAVSTNETSDDTGIVAVGLGVDEDAYVLGDYSGRYTPEQWGEVAIKAYLALKKLGCPVAFLVEDNRIGDNGAANLRAAMRRKKGDNAADALPIVEKHAWDSKGVRADPVAVLTKRGRVHIVGELPALEEEMTSWVPAATKVSPNRIDAMVHGVTVLMGLDTDDEEPAPDPKLAFRGVEAMAAATRSPMAGFSPSSLGLPRAAWGSRL